MISYPQQVIFITRWGRFYTPWHVILYTLAIYFIHPYQCFFHLFDSPEGESTLGRIPETFLMNFSSLLVIGLGIKWLAIGFGGPTTAVQAQTISQQVDFSKPAPSTWNPHRGDQLGQLDSRHYLIPIQNLPLQSQGNAT